MLATLAILDKLRGRDIQNFGDSLSVVISNLGKGAANPSVLRVFSSTDPYLSKDDMEIGQAKIPSIVGGQSSAVSVPVRRAAMNTAPFILLVADSQKTVGESNENNNVRSIERLR